MASYDYWQNALAGNFGEVHDGDAQPGFYRKRLSRAGAFVPVAIWEQDGKMVAVVSGQETDAAEIWSYVCDKPVTEDQYHSRMATGRWWDEDESVTASLTPPPIGHNNGPTDPAEILKEQIETALKGVDDYTTVNDDTGAAKAQSLRSRLLDLSGEADKKREGLVRPHLDAQRDINGLWQPLVKSAKAGADAIRTAISAFETRKLRAAEEAARVAEVARKRAEAEALKAAEAGKPVVAAPPPPPPEPAPAPAMTVRGAYGRAASIKVVKVATVADQDAAYGFLKTNADLVALIQKLAQKAVDAGLTVPGVTVEEQRKVT